MRIKLLCVVVATLMFLILGESRCLYGAGSLTGFSVDYVDTVGVEKSYKFNFTTSVTGNGTGDFGIPVNGKIVLDFDAGFNVSSAEIASFDDANTGGFDVTTGAGNVVILTRDGTGNSIGASTSVSVIVANIKNHTSANTYSVTVTTRTSGDVDIDAYTHPILTINAGDLDHVTIEYNTGGEIGDTPCGAGNTISMIAAGYDVHDNSKGNIAVNWNITGGIGTLSGSGQRTSTTFTAETAGSGTVTINDGSGHEDATGTITVVPGILNYVKIVEGSSGHVEDEFTTKEVTTDETITLHAAGYDSKGNYVGDKDVSWSVSNNLGDFQIDGTTATFFANRVATGTITADHAAVTDDQTGIITVTVGELSYVRIEDDAGGAGNEILAPDLDAGNTLDMYSIGYDADNNYKEDVDVIWTVRGGIGSLSGSGKRASTTFTAEGVGTGTIEIDDENGRTDVTGTITVSEGALSYVKIVEGAAGDGDEFTTRTMTADQTLTLHAAGYDSEDNYLGDQVVNWAVSNSLGSFETNGTTTIFSANLVATGRISVSIGGAAGDETGDIEVEAGALNQVQIDNAADGAGTKITTLSLNAGATQAMHAVGYDADKNFKENVSVLWTLTGGIGSLSGTGKRTSTTLTADTSGTGTVNIDDENDHVYTTGTITVNPNTLDRIVIEDAPGGTGEEVDILSISAGSSLTLYAVGYDAENNFTADVAVLWNVTGGIGTVGTEKLSSTTFSAITAAIGTVTADDEALHTDATGNITVIPGVPASNFKLYPDSVELSADDADLTLITSGVIYDAQSNIISPDSLFTVTVSPQNLEIEITPVDEDITIEGHQVKSNAEGKISFTVQAGTKAGTAFISARSIDGPAFGDTSIVISSIEIISIKALKDTVSQDQDSVDVRMLVENLTPHTLTSVSAALNFKNYNADDRGGDFESIVKSLGEINTGEQSTILFKINVDNDAVAEKIIIDGTVSGMAGAEEVQDLIANKPDTILVQTPPALTITQVDAPQDEVDQGTDATVNMWVRNDGQADATVLDNSIVFIKGTTEPKDVSNEYSVTPDPSNPKIIKGGDPAVQFIYTVRVGANASEGDINLEGEIFGKDVNSDTVFTDKFADINDSWEVKQKGELSVITFEPSQKKLNRSTNTPWSILMSIQNNFETADVVLDSTKLLFIAGTDTITEEYTVVYPDSFKKSIDDTLRAGITDTLTISVQNTGTTTGNVKLEATVFLSDIAKTILPVVGIDGVTVTSSSDLVINDVILLPDEVTANQSNDWQIKATVQNVGASNIVLFFDSDSTYAKFSIDDDFTIIPPTAFQKSNTNIIQSNTIDTIIFNIDETSSTIGNSDVKIKLAFADENSLSDTVTVVDQNASFKVQSKPNVGIKEINNLAPNQPFVNTKQKYQLQVVLENTGDDGVHNLSLLLETDSDSTIIDQPDRVLTLEGNASDTVYFDITADVNSNTSEIFTASIDTAEGDNTSEFDNDIIDNREETLEVRVQESAEISILDVILPADTINALDQNWKVKVVVERKNDGMVEFDKPHADSLKFYVNSVFQNYQIKAPARFVKTNGFRFSNWGTFQDTLIFDILRGTVKGGNASVHVVLTGKYLNNDSSFVEKSLNKNFFIRSSAEIYISKTSVNCLNYNGDIGFLSVDQAFTIGTKIRNMGGEPVNSIQVRLISDDPQRYPGDILTINSIPEYDDTTVVFNQIAQNFEEQVIFTTVIDTAVSGYSGGPADIGDPDDNTAIAQIQKKAELVLEVNKADSVMSMDKISKIRYIIRNVGTAETDDRNAEIRVTLPDNYKILVNSKFDSESVDLSYVTNTWDTLFIKAPNFESSDDEIEITVIKFSIDKNTGNYAFIDKPKESIIVKTVDTELSLISQISEPNGAIDGILSTEQSFIVQSIIGVTDNIKQGSAVIEYPDGYRLDVGQKSIIPISSDTTINWKLFAPNAAHTTQKNIIVTVTGNVDDTEYSENVTIPVTVQKRAYLDLNKPEIIEPEQTETTLSTGQTFTLRTMVENTGAADVSTNGQIRVVFGETGINVTESSTVMQNFIVDEPITWRLKAPGIRVASSPLNVEIVTMPKELNTNQNADIITDKQSLDVKTEYRGFVYIDSVKIVTPEGAKDSTVSTSQEFTVTAYLRWASISDNETPSVEIFPGGFLSDQKIKPAEGVAGRGQASWNLTAPENPVPNQEISFQATAFDKYSGNPVTPSLRKMNITVVEKAEVELWAEVVGHTNSQNITVSTDQEFQIRAGLTNYGDARLSDYYKVTLGLPPGYTTMESISQRVTPYENVTWSITAPSTEKEAKVFFVTLVALPHDENTSDVASVIQSGDEITFAVTTEEKAVAITVLPGDENTSIAIGDTAVPVLGIQFDCSGNEESNVLLFKGVKVNIKNRNGVNLSNPQAAISKISVVDYFNNSIVFGEVNQIPDHLPIEINFTKTDTLYPQLDNRVQFLVNIKQNSAVGNFQVMIDSSSYFNIVDVATGQQPKYKVNGETTSELNVTSGISVLVPRQFDKAFWNYPNPFGAESDYTTFQYYLDQNCDVKIQIYTLLGELVWSYEYSSSDPQGQKGLRSESTGISWNGLNLKDKEVINGVYIALLSTSYGKTVITKVAVVK